MFCHALECFPLEFHLLIKLLTVLSKASRESAAEVVTCCCFCSYIVSTSNNNGSDSLNCLMARLCYDEAKLKLRSVSWTCYITFCLITSHYNNIGKMRVD